MLLFYSDWSVLLPLDGCENPWSNKVVCMVGMSKRQFRWVQLHTTAKRAPCPTFAPWLGGAGTSPTSLVPKKQTHLCQWGAPLICCIAEHTDQKETDYTNPNLARLRFTESHEHALINSHQAWRHDTQSSVVLKHGNSVIATSRRTAPEYTSYP